MWSPALPGRGQEEPRSGEETGEDIIGWLLETHLSYSSAMSPQTNHHLTASHFKAELDILTDHSIVDLVSSKLEVISGTGWSRLSPWLLPSLSSQQIYYVS